MIRIHEEVADALADRLPVVALESTIFSEFGLPPPVNRECLEACVAAVRAGGAVPALTVVLDGEARVGLDEVDWERVLLADRKLGARDVPVAVAGGWPSGATTVSGALSLAAAAGVAVFATGGIGGVHRDATETGDISADLPAIARYPVTTVTAGAKAFLDLPRTVEYLETLGVPVLGLQTDEFPAFYSRTSGVPLPHRVETPAEAAAVVRAARDLGHDGGLLLAVPVPEEAAMPTGGRRRGHRVRPPTGPRRRRPRRGGHPLHPRPPRRRHRRQHPRHQRRPRRQQRPGRQRTLACACSPQDDLDGRGRRGRCRPPW